MRKTREIIVKNGYCELQLTRGKIAFIDSEDFLSCSNHSWCAIKRGNKFYAATTINYKIIYLQVFLLDKKNGLKVGFLDCDTLNCRRNNIRHLTASQSAARCKKRKKHNASSKYKGVSWDKINKYWVATITIKYFSNYLGAYKTEIEAAKAYNKKAYEVYGDYAFLNIIKEV